MPDGGKSRDRDWRAGAKVRLLRRIGTSMSEAKRDREKKSRSGPSSGSFTVARVQVQELAALAGPEGFEAPAGDLMSDELLVDRLLAGESQQYEVLMRRTGARLY